MTVQKIGKILVIVGAIALCGAVGAVECDALTLTEFIIAVVHRFGVTFLGLYLCCYEKKPDEHKDWMEVD